VSKQKNSAALESTIMFPWQRKILWMKNAKSFSEKYDWKQKIQKWKFYKNECFKIRTLNHCCYELRILLLFYPCYSWSSESSLYQVRKLWYFPALDTWTRDTRAIGQMTDILIIYIASPLNPHHSTVKGYSFGSYTD